MPAIPEPTRDSITWRLILHAEKNWPQLDKVQVTCRGNFAYAAGVLPGGEKIPLFRLRYGGSAPSASATMISKPRALRILPPAATTLGVRGWRSGRRR